MHTIVKIKTARCDPFYSRSLAIISDLHALTNATRCRSKTENDFAACETFWKEHSALVCP